MKFTECMIVWNPGTDEIDVCPWPDEDDLSEKYSRSAGACQGGLHEVSEMEREFILFRYFNDVVVRDGVPPQAAHKAFLKIDEYRANLSPDTEGSERRSIFS